MVHFHPLHYAHFLPLGVVHFNPPQVVYYIRFLHVVPLNEKPKSVWLRVIRLKDSIKMMYSLNNQDFKMMRLAYFPDNTPLMVGLTAASPDANGFEALFEDFEVTHLPDSRRKKWLDNN